MNLKGFFGALLMIVGLNIVVLAGACAFLIKLFAGGYTMNGHPYSMPLYILAVGAAVSGLGVMLMDSAGRDRNLTPAEEDKRKAEIMQAMKAGAQKAELRTDGKKDER